MIRLFSACVMGLSVALMALPVQAQQGAQGAQAGAQAAAAKGQNCKKTYVQKKSARTGKYVHVPRQRCE